ncbi:MAG: hypothetical protein RLZZ50_1240 [Verrucomicrobiota bacterium]|jgi:plastocyanin
MPAASARSSAFLAAVLLATAAGAGDLSALVRDADGKPVADAVVSLVPLDAPAPPGAPETHPVKIAQSGKQYRPHVTPVRAGTKVDFPNEDAIQHHIYSLSKAKPFEKPLYEGGSSESVVFDKPGVVTLGCNIHDWMIAYVVVLETPWFAKSDEAGRASVAGLPAGRYAVEVWHPRLAAPVRQELSLTGGGALEQAFELRLKPDRRLRRAPSGENKGY